MIGRDSVTKLSAPIDCDWYARGSTCVVTADGARCDRTPPDVLDPGMSCGAMSFGEVCDGDSLVLCVDGAPTSVPCSSIGLSTCANRRCR